MKQEGGLAPGSRNGGSSGNHHKKKEDALCRHAEKLALA